jgi:hypothetical protein
MPNWHCAKEGEDVVTSPKMESSETNLPYTSKDNSSLTEGTSRDSDVAYAIRRGPQGDGGMRPGDWLVLLIGVVLIIGTALMVLGAF